MADKDHFMEVKLTVGARDFQKNTFRPVVLANLNIALRDEDWKDLKTSKETYLNALKLCFERLSIDVHAADYDGGPSNEWWATQFTKLLDPPTEPDTRNLNDN